MAPGSLVEVFKLVPNKVFHFHSSLRLKNEIFRSTGNQPNMHTKLIRHDIIVHAPPTKVWKVLTSSEYAQQFLFDEELQSEWIKGSPILLEVDNDGRKESLTRGMVEEVVPGISLQFTLYDLPQFSGGRVLCQYELVPGEDGLRLVVSQEVLLFSNELYAIMSKNCQMMLQKIKWLAEYS